ncbi:recombinase family protein [Allokutzneria albata]|uniref:Site-specific DNA recombinase n=1 Tax=Allokutzneria albata TaxID=211114 RepID=A0A1G9Y8Q2_ALLAB|nr:recombinase family protein [Allokutzneria albata]SDN05036.1 Site-specific DNA recombinase [Allokutzneria albata]
MRVPHETDDTSLAPAAAGDAGSLLAAAPASGPSGLSDYAVSPWGVPMALLCNEVRVAFLGRTSTEDQQDPRQSVLRQLNNCKSAVPESWVVVAHFYDVESGRMPLDQRGQGAGFERFDIPIARDGGITDLLGEAQHPGRRFDVVICESISRIARHAYEGLRIERELERAEVPLFAANEPIALAGSRAQRIFQRRINQSVAEYEVLNTLELSWGGLCTHVREGWNIGKPPYGYKAKTFRHPNPAKALKGHTKTRLEPDGLRAETVTQIALWRYHEGLGYDTIAERLNTDLTQYPPPIPAGRHRARGAWGKTSVYEILCNPKYTGYQVFNRRASHSRHGKVNDPAKWVWSLSPAHEPLIPKWMYDELTATRRAKQGSRDGDTPNRHPQTQRTYVLRGIVFCHCGRRMCGNHRHNTTYYMCNPRNNNRGRPDKYAHHPKTVYLREDTLLDALSTALTHWVFGPERRTILGPNTTGTDPRVVREREAERERLQQNVAEATRQQNTILRQALDGPLDDPFTKALRVAYNALEVEKTTALATIAQFDTTNKNLLRHRATADVALLRALPDLTFNLADAPEALTRRLFGLTQLNVRLHKDREHVTVTLRISASQMRRIVQAAEKIDDVAVETRSTLARTAGTARVETTHLLSEARSTAPPDTDSTQLTLHVHLQLSTGLPRHHVDEDIDEVGSLK